MISADTSLALAVTSSPPCSKPDGNISTIEYTTDAGNRLTLWLKQLLDLQGCAVIHRIGTYVDRSSTSIDDQHLIAVLLTRIRPDTTRK